MKLSEMFRNMNMPFVRQDDTRDYTVNAVALLCDKPIYSRVVDGVTMGLYIIGSDELWVNVDRVNERKATQRMDEASLDEVAFLLASQLVVDEKTGEAKYRYLLSDGRVGEYTSSQVVAKRRELSAKKHPTLFNSCEEESENEV